NSRRVQDSGDRNARSRLQKSVMDIFGEVQERMSGMTGVDVEKGLKDVLKQTEEAANQKQGTTETQQTDATEESDETSTESNEESLSGTASSSLGEAENSAETEFQEDANASVHPDTRQKAKTEDSETETSSSSESADGEETPGAESENPEASESTKGSTDGEFNATDKENLKQYFTQQAEKQLGNHVDDKTKDKINELV